MKKIKLIVALFMCYSVQAQVGIGIPNPDASAVLELASTQKGFLPPRLTTAERDAIKNPAEGLTIFNTTKNCLEWYLPTGWYNACGDNGVATVTNYVCNTLETGDMVVGIPISNVSQTITATVSVPGSYNINATANGVTFSASGNFTFTGDQEIILQATGTPIATGSHDFNLNTGSNSCSFKRNTEIVLTVIGKTGKVWMAYNLGATAPATSMSDAAQYGNYYQWGRGNDGHQKQNSPMTTKQSTTDTPGHNNLITKKDDWRSPANANLWQGIKGTNNPCPQDFRIPTIAEWNAEFSASGITNTATAFNSVLKLPAGGYRNYNDGIYTNTATNGYYWSSTTDSNGKSYYKLLSSSKTSSSDGYRASTISVRCIKN